MTAAAQLSRQLGPQTRQLEAARIRRVLAQRHLHMVFQPVFDLARRAVISCEALARFRREPARSPAAWFAAAADVGLGVELELAAVDSALARLDEVSPSVSLSLNVSASTALSPRLAEAVEPVADRLVLEITEHAEVEDYEALRDALAPLRARGILVAADDVGAGFASLRHVLLLAPDMMKLDLSVTREIAMTPARARVRRLVEFAADADISVVAEGIETSAELDLVRELGVGYGQGFFLGRPTAVPG